jgi:hypothetical protein
MRFISGGKRFSQIAHFFSSAVEPFPRGGDVAMVAKICHKPDTAYI